ncbi:PTS sugar transporter subunit IIA [Enterococcus sp. BWB1-3]|uniref:PTS sugar transporter subunit IIA n=1 Tax=unclassified Enterococcus TaxID=2608891 RepID=UPI001924DC3C|nr:MULTISPECIES: PTS sugar transporter subunit IIA [unclassified Enterococcus]MBL1228206.1 PTS sugar transporter subunit IIA [Enterococcus sp. BWB1-3]MCB5951943.1 PTS sugar transporter subunit IIA [Enterococcus sp. BWT-B8]MCB5954139.1 PTS sugar transporter subunit IIA [Enterococcus sp. CWB-B31]
MLGYFYENDLIRLSEKVPENWEEAVKISCENLLEKEIINQTYIDEIIDCVKEFGPYIVIVPGVAMPHSSEKSEGVFGTAISFTKMPKEIVFEEGNAEKNASLFFTLAAKNSEEHVQNISKLSEMLMVDGLIDDLSAIETMSDYKDVMEKYQL